MTNNPVTASNAFDALKKCPFCNGGGFEINLDTARGVDRKVKLTHWCEHQPGVREETMSITASDLDAVVMSWNSQNRISV